MPRTRQPRRNRQSPEVESLIHLARSLAQSSSHVEDIFWEARLVVNIDKLIASADDDAFNTALDNLSQTDPRACDALADMLEYRCESRGDSSSSERDVLLFTSPLLVWSRYTIPSGPIATDALLNIKVHLAAHVFAANVRLGLADILFSPDQLPQGFVETARMKDRLIKAAVHGRDLHIDAAQLDETINFLSDTRYLVGVVVVDKGAPVFRWQESGATATTRDTALIQWRKQGGEALRPLLPACASELLLPLAYHSGCREADRQSRPYSIRASVAFLNAAINVTADQLIAVVAPFQENRVEEYRVGFVLKSDRNLVHGVVWPLLDAEDAHESPVLIEAVLRECGIQDIQMIDHVYPLEYCDDCGAPLYPNADDEAVHAELPEGEVNQPSQHLH